MLVAEIVFAVVLLAALLYEFISVSSNFFYIICFTIPDNLLAILFGIVFKYLYDLNKKMDGIFCNPGLMLLHFLTFVLATFLSDVDLVLGIFDTSLH